MHRHDGYKDWLMVLRNEIAIKERVKTEAGDLKKQHKQSQADANENYLLSNGGPALAPP